MLTQHQINLPGIPEYGCALMCWLQAPYLRSGYNDGIPELNAYATIATAISYGYLKLSKDERYFHVTNPNQILAFANYLLQNERNHLAQIPDKVLTTPDELPRTTVYQMIQHPIRDSSLTHWRLYDYRGDHLVYDPSPHTIINPWVRISVRGISTT
jgi:hypothetical protein